MTIKTKLLATFASLLLLLVVIGALSWRSLNQMGDNIKEIGEWKIPAAKNAVLVHAGAYDATIDQLSYVLYEQDKYHQKAQKDLDAMLTTLDKIDVLTQTYNDTALKEKSVAVRKNVDDFRKLYDQGVALLKDNKTSVKTMLTTGGAVLEQADNFAAKQEEEYTRLLQSGTAEARSLDERVQQYIVVNRIKVMAMTIIRHEKEERLHKDRKFYSMMLDELQKLFKFYDDLQKITTDKDELRMIEVARQATSNYAKAAEAWIKNDDHLKEVLQEMDGIAASARDSAQAAENGSWEAVDTIAKSATQAVKTANMIVLVVVLLSVVLSVVMALWIITTITRSLKAALQSVQTIAEGDLSRDIVIESKDEIGALLGALSQMQEKLVDVVSQVGEAVDSIYGGAREISHGNTNLSQRTEEQAASLEETASSMEELTSTVKQNADNAAKASQLATDSCRQAENGGQIVSKAITAMGEINTASKKISDIIDVIDEIAFQTNLLALNAAVEAARAGDQGRGFAVVASEVRKLAQHSASAAKEISDLISTSVTKVEEGSKLVDQSGRALEDIVNSVKKVTDIVAEIAAAGKEQHAGIEQVNRTITQMDEVTQQNAALVEQTAAAAKSLEERGKELQEMMTFFHLEAHPTGRN